MDKELARIVVHELNRKLLLIMDEQDSVKRMQIVNSILMEDSSLPIEEQGEEKQLKVLLGI